MKIGIVCYPTQGGSGVLATELGHALARRGHEIHFIAYEIPFRLRLESEKIFFHEVEINQYELFKYPDYALNLAVKIAQISHLYQLDILHVHYAIPHATSAYLSKQMNRADTPRVITTLHGTDITLVGKDPSYFPIVQFSIEKSCGITAVSQHLAAQTRHYFDIQKPIQVIYNFFVPKPELIGHKPLKQQFAPNDEKLILHSSNFRSVKRTEDVLKIFLMIKEEMKCRLLFLGSGPDLNKLRFEVKQFGLEEDVFFLGKNSEIDAYVASADLFLLPSSQESFGLAALEAMAYGVPVVASNVGGLPELIVNGESGFLHSVGDVTAMAKSAIELLNNKELYQRVSQAAQRRASDQFSVDRIIVQYEQFYQYILQSATNCS